MVDLKSFLAHFGPACLSSVDTSKMVFPTGSAGARLRCRRCRSSCGSPGTDNNLLSIHELSETLDAFRHSDT